MGLDVDCDWLIDLVKTHLMPQTAKGQAQAARARAQDTRACAPRSPLSSYAWEKQAASSSDSLRPLDRVVGYEEAEHRRAPLQLQQASRRPSLLSHDSLIDGRDADLPIEYTRTTGVSDAAVAPSVRTDTNARNHRIRCSRVDQQIPNTCSLNPTDLDHYAAVARAAGPAAALRPWGQTLPGGHLLGRALTGVCGPHPRHRCVLARLLLLAAAGTWRKCWDRGWQGS